MPFARRTIGQRRFGGFGLIRAILVAPARMPTADRGEGAPSMKEK